MMDALLSPSLALPDPGAPFEGGYYAGKIVIHGRLHALICAGAAEGDHAPVAWNKSPKPVDGAMSFFDGLGNTRAMAEAGSAPARWALELRINGCDDWYIPARDELEILYRIFKPTAEHNWAWRGDNPSSVPVGYAYSPTSPGQTSIEPFRAGGAEAFHAALYWSSTQYAGVSSSAWFQTFAAGNQYGALKSFRFRRRAVRRLPL